VPIPASAELWQAYSEAFVDNLNVALDFINLSRNNRFIN
jgi:hypothetical protein